MNTHNFLFELGTEELPPKSLLKLSTAFEVELLKGLDDAELSYGSVKSFASPRRLAIVINELQASQPDRNIQRRGPAIAAAYDSEGNPSKALQGFARSCGAELSDLVSLKTDKGEWLAYNSEKKGAAAGEILPKLIEHALSRLPIAKRMRWGNKSVEFVRPVKWLTALLDEQVMPLSLFDLDAGNTTRGHRFHSSAEIVVPSPAAYQNTLKEQGFVIADYQERLTLVEQQVKQAAESVGGIARIDSGLLNEVTGLVEWPNPIVGHFSEKFLDMPSEVIISTIEDHQKYFPVFDANGKLMTAFVTLSNINSRKPELVAQGNERVVGPRLEDALFFWTQDQKISLSERREKLKPIVFQQKLGSVFDKTQRVTQLALSLASEVGAEPNLVQQAGDLCRSDLTTNVVYEMPELQGLMGRYYAELEGLPAEVCAAMDEQYQPRFAGDQLPKTNVGTALALAEKIDSICGIFAIGKKPTGDKDPYALRRAAIGVLRILIENTIALSLPELISQSVALQPVKVEKQAELIADITRFFNDRLRALMIEQGVSADQFDAVLAANPATPLDAFQRISSVSQFLQSDDAVALAAANKRIRNILRKNADSLNDAFSVSETALQDSEEKALFAQLNEVKSVVLPLVEQRNYAAALQELSKLRNAVDSFFENTMVMADDLALRNNRLALLNSLQSLFLSIADFSLIQS